MKKIISATILLLALLAISVVIAAATHVAVNGGTIQEFRLKAGVDFPLPTVSPDE